MAGPAGPLLDPRTPVLVGVGQASDPIDGPNYRRLSPVELAAAAAREALADTGADPAALAAGLDTVAGIRQFENSFPGVPAPLGRSDNFPRAVAARLDARPARAILEVVGGQGPQHLVTELAGTIAAGRGEAALVFGAEATSTVRHLADAPDRPNFTESVGGDLEDRGFGLEGLATEYTLTHGLTDAPTSYALFDNARRARLGCSRADYLLGMGELFAPLSAVAAANPHAAAPTERSATELAIPTAANRPITDPYLRYLVARDQVNQGAAILITSVAAARRLGVGEDRWVFLHGHADLRERDLLDRADLSTSPSAVMATQHALEVAGIGVDDLSTLDLYSCFPIAVSTIADAFGLAADDPRGLTLTGGLPFFGGAGNNYSMHAIAETVGRLRRSPGAYGLVAANGGILSKHSVGVYSTTPIPWRGDRSAELQDQILARPAAEQVDAAEGPATIETYTVKHDRGGARTGVVVGRLEATGARFLALATDDATLEVLTGADEPIGMTVHAQRTAGHNTVAVGSP